MLEPICSEVLIFDAFSACESVLTQMKSTPSMPLVTMCETALPPPPPTPITLITALWLYASMSSNICQLLKSEISLNPVLHARQNPCNVAADHGSPRRRRAVLACV